MVEPRKDSLHTDSIGEHIEHMCRVPSVLTRATHDYDRITPQGAQHLRAAVFISLDPGITKRIEDFIMKELHK